MNENDLPYVDYSQAQLANMTKQELARIACLVARVAAIVCDVAKVPAAPNSAHEPYIWDTPTKE